MGDKIAGKTARLAVYLTLALLLSALEMMLPIPFAPPGVKLGLTNLVTVYLLYRYGFRDALLVSAARVLLTGLVFGPNTIIFALPSAIIALIAMGLIRRAKVFTPTGASIAGGVFFNLTQLSVAALMVKTAALVSYLPILTASGALTGMVVGVIASVLLRRLTFH